MVILIEYTYGEKIVYGFIWFEKKWETSDN